MWNRKELKKKGKENLKRNYWKIVIFCLIILIFAGGYQNVYTPLSFLDQYSDSTNSIDGRVNELNQDIAIENIDEFIKSQGNSVIWETLAQYHPTRGILSGVFNSITDSNSLVYGILNLLNKDIFSGRISVLVLFLLGTLIFVFLQIFVKNMLLVGEKRFFMESRVYEQTHIDALIMPFQIRKGYLAGITMFVRSIYQVLWFLTIAGGIIKHYSYYLVPYILAENPTIKPNEAISLSRKMMDGYKWETFKLELSFIGWYLLNIATFGLLSVFFLNPYLTATKTELYMSIRESTLEKNPEISLILCDKGLNDTGGKAHYANSSYPLELREYRLTSDKNHNIRYNLYNIIMMFFIFSFIGWCWEVSLYLVTDGIFVNRGTMHGPWLPIYGSGGIIMLMLLKRFSKWMGKTFILCIITAAILEYSVATFLWHMSHMKWWDYTGYFLNLNGRICLEGLLVFAIAGILMIYIIAPALNRILSRFRYGHIKMVSFCLLLIFIIDVIYSIANPNMGEGITTVCILLSTGIG